jgi:hypothetical protein
MVEWLRFLFRYGLRTGSLSKIEQKNKEFRMDVRSSDLYLLLLTVCLSFFIYKSLFFWFAVHRGSMPYCLCAPLCLRVFVVQKN